MDHEIILRKLFEVINSAGIFYDSVHLIDPVTKKIIYSIKTNNILQLNDEGHSCYTCRNRRTACKSCIITKASENKKVLYKIIFENSKLYLVTAIPIGYDDIQLVAEVIKDISGSGFIDIEEHVSLEIQKLINFKDNTVIKESFRRIYNDQFIYKKILQDMNTCREENRSLTLYHLCLTNLKIINDLYGYEAGNCIIKNFSKTIRLYCRKTSDWTTRYSGSIFIIVMFDIDENQAYKICKRIYDKVYKTELCRKVPNKDIALNIGFHMILNEKMTPEELIQTAGKHIFSASQGNIAADSKTAFEEFIQKYALTEREREAAVLVLQGLSNNEIAEKMFISLPTVKKHISNILDKAEVKSRSEFISKY